MQCVTIIIVIININIIIEKKMSNKLQRMINLCNTWIAVDQRQSQQLINPLTDPDDDEEEIFYHLNHLFVQPEGEEPEDAESAAQPQTYTSLSTWSSGQSEEAMHSSISYAVDRILHSLDEDSPPSSLSPPTLSPESSSACLPVPCLPPPPTLHFAPVPEVPAQPAHPNVTTAIPAMEAMIRDISPPTCSPQTPPEAPVVAAIQPCSQIMIAHVAPRVQEITEGNEVQRRQEEEITGARDLVLPDVFIPLRIQTADALLKSYPVTLTTSMKERARHELDQPMRFMKSSWPILMPDLESRIQQMIFFKDHELNNLMIACLSRSDCLSSLSRAVRVCARIFWSEREILLDRVTRNIFFNRRLHQGDKLLNNIVHFYEIFVYIFDFDDATAFNSSDLHRHVYTHLSNYQMQIRISKAGGRAVVQSSSSIGVGDFVNQWRQGIENPDIPVAKSRLSERPISRIRSGRVMKRRRRRTHSITRRTSTCSTGSSSRASSSGSSGGSSSSSNDRSVKEQARIMPSRRVKNEGHDRLAKLAAAVRDRSDDEDDDDLMRKRRNSDASKIVPLRSSSVIGFSQAEAHNVGIRLRKLTSQPYVCSRDPLNEPQSWLTDEVEERIRKLHLFTSNSHEQDQLLRKLILREDSVSDIRTLIKNVAIVMIGRKDVPSDYGDEDSGDRMSEDDESSNISSGDRRSLIRYSVGFKATVLLLMRIFGHDWHGPADVEKFKRTHVYEHLINFIHDNDYWLD